MCRLLSGSNAFQFVPVEIQNDIAPKAALLTVGEEENGKEDVAIEALEAPMARRFADRTRPTSPVEKPWERWFVDAKQIVCAIIKGKDLTFLITAAMLLVMDAVHLSTDEVMIALGLLEPVLAQDMVRLRWRCVRNSTLCNTARS